MSGIFFPRAGQLRVNLRFSIGQDGQSGLELPRAEMRFELWPQWLQESIEATTGALRTHALVLAEVAEPTNDVALGDLLDAELRASMRGITSAAFAIDAFYAGVRSRSPAHPDHARWRTPGRRPTPRAAQISETLRFNLKLRQEGAGELRRRLQEIFQYRDWAVHPHSSFRDPVLREDINRGVAWQYAAFRAENAAAVCGMTVQTLDLLVDTLSRGCDELREWRPLARERMDEICALYGAQSALAPTRPSDDNPLLP